MFFAEFLTRDHFLVLYVCTLFESKFMIQDDRKMPLPPVIFHDYDICRLFESATPLNVSVYHNGLQKHLLRTFVQGSLYEIENSHSMESLLSNLKEVKSKMIESGLFKDIQYSIEPAKEADNNIIVRFDVVESNGRKEIGIHMDTKGKPEIKISMANIFDKVYTVAFECLPTKICAGLNEVKSNFQWFDPFFGQSFFASWIQGIQDHGTLHNLDRETHCDFSAGVHFGPSYNRNSISVSRKSSFLQSSSPDTICSQMSHFHMSERKRIGIEFESIQKNLQYHKHLLLRKIYSLPIGGLEMRFRAGLHRVRSEVLREIPSAPKSIVNEIRLEGFFASHHALNSLITLGFWGKVGGFLPLSKISNEKCSLYPHVLDKYFLGSSHIRGFTFVGPSICNQQRYESISQYESEKITSPLGSIQKLGSSMYGVFSSSLGFPMPFFGGLVAGHLFINTGYARDFTSDPSGVSWNNFIRSFCTSTGGGLILNQIPGMGSITSGRLEFNFAIPLFVNYWQKIMRVDDSNNLSFWNRKDMFQKMKFGLNWSSE